MTTIQEQARAAQAQALGGDEALVAATTALYDSVDALTAEQKTLLVKETLVRLSALVHNIQNAQSANVAHALGALAHAMIGVAAYGIEGYRESLDFTVTGDRKVDNVLEGVQSVMQQFATSKMSPEERAFSEGIKERVAARVANGEDFETCMREELSEHEAEIKDLMARKSGAPAPVAKAETEASGGYGMYL